VGGFQALCFKDVNTFLFFFPLKVSEVTAMVWNKYKLKEPSAASSSPEDFVLKVTGYKEYLFGMLFLSLFNISAYFFCLRAVPTYLI
jgi:hypothetical protein